MANMIPVMALIDIVKCLIVAFHSVARWSVWMSSLHKNAFGFPISSVLLHRNIIGAESAGWRMPRRDLDEIIEKSD